MSDEQCSSLVGSPPLIAQTGVRHYYLDVRKMPALLLILFALPLAGQSGISRFVFAGNVNDG